MNISVTQLYALLSEKLDKNTAGNLTAYIEAKIDKTVVDKNRYDQMVRWFVSGFSFNGDRIVF